MTRRAVVDLVRTATLGSYGVTGFTDPNLIVRLLRWARFGPQGLRVRLEPTLDIDLWIAVAWGLPVAEVARQVDSAVRYSVRRALDREIDALSIHVNRLRILPGAPPAPGSAPAIQHSGPAVAPTAADAATHAEPPVPSGTEPDAPSR